MAAGFFCALDLGSHCIVEVIEPALNLCVHTFCPFGLNLIII